MTPKFDPLAPGFFDDPYTHYAELRDGDPVHRMPYGVICFAYDDVWRVLRQQGLTMGPSNVPRGEGVVEPAALFPRGLINLDPPDHPRVRRLMSRIFTPRKIEAMTASISADVVTMLDDVERMWRETGEPVDLISTLAFPLPFKVISDVLGMPPTDDSQIRAWAQAVTNASVGSTGTVLTRASEAYRAICDYVDDEVLPWKRDHLGDDLLSILLIAQSEGETLSRDEFLDQVTLLYVAGHETTSGLIGNGVLNLLRHPGELRRLTAAPDLLPNAIEELNRFDSAIQFTWRYPLEEIELGGEVVRVGEMVLLGLGSANRDPHKFGEDAGELDLTRDGARDALSFGAGPHFCLGASLARREGALAIGGLLARFPEVTLADRPVWNPRVTFRAPHSLPVALA